MLNKKTINLLRLF